MVKYRNSLQITCSVLETSLSETDTSTILRKSNISHPRLKPIINNLLGNGLINKIEVKGKNTFIITGKGRLYLDEYKKFSNLADSFGLEI